MFGRAFPTLLLLLGAFCFIFGFANAAPSPRWITAALAFYAFLFPALLIWSYFFGPQKGRPVHFVQIVIYCVFATCFAANAARYISDTALDIAAVVLFVTLGFFVTMNYRAIQSDYKMGIKRNFFDR